MPFAKKELSDDEDGLDEVDLGLDDVDEFSYEEEKGNETVRTRLPVLTEQIRIKVEEMSKPALKTFSHIEATSGNVNMPYASL